METPPERESRPFTMDPPLGQTNEPIIPDEIYDTVEADEQIEEQSQNVKVSKMYIRVLPPYTGSFSESTIMETPVVEVDPEPFTSGENQMENEEQQQSSSDLTKLIIQVAPENTDPQPSTSGIDLRDIEELPNATTIGKMPPELKLEPSTSEMNPMDFEELDLYASSIGDADLEKSPDSFRLEQQLSASEINENDIEELSLSCDGMPMEELSNVKFKKAPSCVEQRYIVVFMLFLGMVNMYIARASLTVSLVAMVNHTGLPNQFQYERNDCGCMNVSSMPYQKDGPYLWDTSIQSYILSSFYLGYLIFQVPISILAKKHGGKYFLFFGMLISSIFSFLVPLAAAAGPGFLMFNRFIQGLGQSVVVPCTHTLLDKWIPSKDRCRLGVFVNAGAQFGTFIALPVSGYLSEYGFAGGWPSIFYVFGTINVAWCILFLIFVFEDPVSHPWISNQDKINISQTVPIIPDLLMTPWSRILKSTPFWAIVFAHIGHEYVSETITAGLPLYMKQVLQFKIYSSGILASLPYLGMWLFSFPTLRVADWLLNKKEVHQTTIRKLFNTIGLLGPAVFMVITPFVVCNPPLTVTMLTIGISLNGAVYSGFKANHTDISPSFAGILMTITNTLANFSGLLAPILAATVIEGNPNHTGWAIVFYTVALIHTISAVAFLIFSSAERQAWDRVHPKKERAVKLQTFRQYDHSEVYS